MSETLEYRNTKERGASLISYAIIVAVLVTVLIGTLGFVRNNEADKDKMTYRIADVLCFMSGTIDKPIEDSWHTHFDSSRLCCVRGGYQGQPWENPCR